MDKIILARGLSDDLPGWQRPDEPVRRERERTSRKGKEHNGRKTHFYVALRWAAKIRARVLVTFAHFVFLTSQNHLVGGSLQIFSVSIQELKKDQQLENP
ncbi:hypothetical protein RUM43_003170 [Polyplax serrata]|uniref:Uncharacterized protein n=1 Tax=Polyplax serrata TaxID=468196 RepID=A0AAN8PE18_POLSC